MGTWSPEIDVAGIPVLSALSTVACVGKEAEETVVPEATEQFMVAYSPPDKPVVVITPIVTFGAMKLASAIPPLNIRELEAVFPESDAGVTPDGRLKLTVKPPTFTPEGRLLMLNFKVALVGFVEGAGILLLPPPPPPPPPHPARVMTRVASSVLRSLVYRIEEFLPDIIRMIPVCVNDFKLYQMVKKFTSA